MPAAKSADVPTPTFRVATSAGVSAVLDPDDSRASIGTVQPLEREQRALGKVSRGLAFKCRDASAKRR
jgi:hypothetical protein